MISNVSREQVRRYLIWNGWEQQILDVRSLIYFTHDARRDDSNELIRLALPVSDTADVDIRIAELLESLAIVEDRPLRGLIDSIQSTDRDIFYLALPSESGFRRGVPLGSAAEIVTSLRDLVSHAAANEIAPTAYRPRITETAKKHAESCVFGHTFKGSFGFTVETPLPIGARRDVPLLPPERIDRPFERRVTERLAAGIRDLAEAARLQSIEILLEHAPSGLNSNMCEELLVIGETANGSPTTYSIGWSPEWPVLKDLTDFAPVRIDERGYRCLQSFIREVRPPEESAELTIEGRVVIMESRQPPLFDDEEEHKIVVAAEVEGRRRNVHVALSAAEYRDACDAHLEGNDVSIEGVLEKRGKYWTLTAPSGFHVLREEAGNRDEG